MLSLIQAAFRNAFFHQGAQVGRRAPQVVSQTKSGTRSASSQTKPAAKEVPKTEEPTINKEDVVVPKEVASTASRAPKAAPYDWDYLVMDVCFLAKM